MPACHCAFVMGADWAAAEALPPAATKPSVTIAAEAQKIQQRTRLVRFTSTHIPT
jgi:hypothetical protein